MATRKTTKTTDKKKPVTRKTTVKVENPVTENTESRVSASRPRRLPKFRPARRFIVPIVIIAVIGVAIYLLLTKFVIAWVDKKPIFAIQYYSQLDQKYGSALKDQMVSEQLVEDEAANRHVSASEQEVNDQIKTIYDQEGGQANVEQILASQGLTPDEFKQQVKLQILINKMFGNNVTVTDDEVNKYIDDNKSQFPDVNDTVKSQVKDQLKSDKVRTAFQDWLQKALKDKSRVIRT